MSLDFATLRDSLPQVASAIRQERRRRKWASSPEAWADERAQSFLWSKQRDILQSIVENRRTAVKSCHGAGKSFTAAQAVAWWLDIHPPGKASVVTTAPTDRQVRVILWKEIRRVHARAKLNGRTNQKEWYMTTLSGVEERVAFGMKPSDYDPAAFQGIHARYVLVVLDEACGIPGKTQDNPQSLWDAADSLLSNDDCRELAIGNPDDSSSEFAQICKPGSGWNVIGVSAFDTPNFTGEIIPGYLRHDLVGTTWIEEKRKAWAPEWSWTEDGKACVPPEGAKVEDAHPLWLSKVIGVFPEFQNQTGLLRIPWVERAMKQYIEPGTPNVLSLDVGAGGDASCLGHRLGKVFRVLSEDHNPDTMQTTGKTVAERRRLGAAQVKVDEIGIGKGVTDRGKELGEPFVGINVGEAANDSEHFANRRAELWWGIRDRFESGDIDLDPKDEALAAELLTIRYKRNSRGQILIESKDEAKRRGVRSPNRAEALMLAFAEPREDDSPTFKVLW